MSPKNESQLEYWGDDFHEQYRPASRVEKEFKLTHKLILTARRWTNHIDATVKAKTGLSRARWQTLSALSFSGAPVSVGALSRRLSVKWPTLVRTLNNLEAEGLISKNVDPSDQRSQLVTITSQGTAMWETVRAVLDPERASVLANISSDDLANAERVLEVVFTELASRGQQ